MSFQFAADPEDRRDQAGEPSYAADSAAPGRMGWRFVHSLRTASPLLRSISGNPPLTGKRLEMVDVYLKEMPSDVGPEYLTAADIQGDEQTTIIRDWDFRSPEALYVRGHLKPIICDKKTLDSLALDFNEKNRELWIRREITLSAASETEISVKATVKYRPPTPKPKTNLAIELADALARATAAPHTRADTIEILRAAANLLATRQ
jgi:hypothetical protein